MLRSVDWVPPYRWDGASVPLVTEKCRYQWRADPNIGVNCRNVSGEDLVAEFGIGPHLYVDQCGNEPKMFREYIDPVSHQGSVLNDAVHGARWGCTFHLHGL